MLGPYRFIVSCLPIVLSIVINKRILYCILVITRITFYTRWPTTVYETLMQPIRANMAEILRKCRGGYRTLGVWSSGGVARSPNQKVFAWNDVLVNDEQYFFENLGTIWILKKGKKSIYIAPFTVIHSKRSDVDHTVLPANNTTH